MERRPISAPGRLLQQKCITSSKSSDAAGSNDAFTEYLSLLKVYEIQRGKEALKNVVLYLQAHQDEQERAKIATPRDVWAKMVYAFVRRMPGRKLEGGIVNGAHLDNWDVIAKKMLHPCSLCKEGGYRCEASGNPNSRVDRCRECIMKRRVCTLSDSAAGKRESLRLEKNPRSETNEGSPVSTIGKRARASQVWVEIEEDTDVELDMGGDDDDDGDVDDAEIPIPQKRRRVEQLEVQVAGPSTSKLTGSGNNTEKEMARMNAQILELQGEIQKYEDIRTKGVRMLAGFTRDMMDILKELPQTP